MMIEAATRTDRTSWNATKRSVAAGYGFATQNPSWTLADVLLATGGRFLSGATDTVFRRVVTDSRQVEPGDLFVALPGERFDGHTFVVEAVRRGAAGVLVDRAPSSRLPAAVILVENTLRALGDLAHHRRMLMPDLKVVAVTGSSGKTTVKEMTAAILAREFQVLKTQGNFNNLVGLPLSLLPVEFHHDAAVLEMGMNRPGEIARLAEVAVPDVACITNVQEAHLAGLGTVENVARAKGELFDRMKAWGTLAVNIDDPRIRRLARKHPQNKVTFGRGRQAMVRALRPRALGEGGTSFTLTIGDWSERVRIQAIGLHNVMNALAAAACCVALGVEPESIAQGLQLYEPPEKRLEILLVAGGVRVINDTYNANPSSMLAALEAAAGLRRKGGKVVAVLGDMLELGSRSGSCHRFIGSSAAGLGFDLLMVVGEFAGEVVAGARNAGMSSKQSLRFANKNDVVTLLTEMVASGGLKEGDVILVKGSRGMRMETVVDALRTLYKE